MTTDQIHLHIEDTGGEGRPVILIHGWPLSGESWAGQVGALSDAGYRVITYDRRGFGQSGKEGSSYDYDTLADDLNGLLTSLDLRDATLVGFSMGGGEVARYAARYGLDRVHSVVFAAAVPPYLMVGEDNPNGPLDEGTYKGMRSSLAEDREGFFEEFTTGFFSVNGQLAVSEEQRQDALRMARQSDQDAALACMDAWATTDFRGDLAAVQVPTLIVHGDSDGTVPFEGSGQRTHRAIAGSELELIKAAPHGLNVSHSGEFNAALLTFLRKH